MAEAQGPALLTVQSTWKSEKEVPPLVAAKLGDGIASR
jgi:hypothetical protein